MKLLSPQAQLLLSRYKTTQVLGDDESARLFDVIQERALNGDLPRVDIDPRAPVVPKEGLVQVVWASPLTKVCLGFVLLGVPAAAQLARGGDGEAPPELAQLRAPPSTPHVERPMTPPPALPEAPRYTASAHSASDPHEAPPEKPQRTALSENAPARELTIDDEMRLMNAAQVALRGGNAQRALQLLGEHATRFPAGKLSSAREVTGMLALCQSGRDEQARAEADRFLAQYPASPFADRVKKICAVPPSKP